MDWEWNEHSQSRLSHEIKVEPLGVAHWSKAQSTKVVRKEAQTNLGGGIEWDMLECPHKFYPMYRIEEKQERVIRRWKRKKIRDEKRGKKSMVKA